VLLKTNSSDKQPRRDVVLKNHKVVMLLGDNLSDFLSVFMSDSIKERNQLVDDLKEEFGERFIVLPNPMYGDWENHGIYQGKYDWTSKQKDSIRRAKLIKN
jgi:5'-nucleotidase (lipoprotein e(P4) family)